MLSNLLMALAPLWVILLTQIWTLLVLSLMSLHKQHVPFGHCLLSNWARFDGAQHVIKTRAVFKYINYIIESKKRLHAAIINMITSQKEIPDKRSRVEPALRTKDQSVLFPCFIQLARCKVECVNSSVPIAQSNDILNRSFLSIQSISLLQLKREFTLIKATQLRPWGR